MNRKMFYLINIVNVVNVLAASYAYGFVMSKFKEAHRQGYTNGWEDGMEWARSHDDEGNPI